MECRLFSYIRKKHYKLFLNNLMFRIQANKDKCIKKKRTNVILNGTASIDNGAHGTENLLLNTHVSEYFA